MELLLSTSFFLFLYGSFEGGTVHVEVYKILLRLGRGPICVVEDGVSVTTGAEASSEVSFGQLTILWVYERYVAIQARQGLCRVGVEWF